ncbi:MAG: DNA topoisomerase I [Candidatus Pacebacteria bacterium CG1_02_43_31]|nr:type I DNA topoisomerase [Candidatus Pacearchaeota archaeon]NCQ65394.1 type I DNA topoisomerase [Candidatus Paceibacterota bacterium]OIO44224.1 MAG: DNA topoisomerase I [Candidatus Pacebacteria bacterium CG1_02_43_31]PIQ80778.1 MAG: DNA topoisomerase I [Candidatus Pacebacteria bacterium CG11_big_fil_rev_8_21_14_0_20_34_55]PJC43882.1 MAG: type I DNA topoisomerase [Candidatus Pacebacteria bacterium CG_4_9_14_0_2_um_filter_34_50]
MNLVIVESPTKARKLSKFLGKDYIVEASVGHIRDLPKSGLSVDTENNFEPTYAISKDKNKVVSKLRAAAVNADKIYLATDPDREGEAIAWHVKYVLENTTGKNKTKAKFLRATFHEITKSAVLKAMENPTELSMDMVDAQQARRVVDRLVGYKLSPVLWKKVRRGLSAGRVQSVALRLIVEKEREIEAFIAEEYWELDVALSANKLSGITAFTQESKVIEDLNQDVFISRVISVEGKKFEPKKKGVVEPVLAVLDDADYLVEAIEKKERSRVSLPPFTTSTMQQKSATSFGYSGKQTMSLAQHLYEEGLITYHRTDSVVLSQTAVDMARGFIASEYGNNYLPKAQNIFSKKSKNAQEAHEAIRVTDITIQGNDILQKSARFTPQHVKLYDLIWRRFVSSQMEKAAYSQTSITIEFKNDKSNGPKSGMLRTSGSILKFDGWMRLFPNREDTLLPDLSEGQTLNFVDKSAAQKFTQPPARFNDASLIKELEKRGIGRPSTYASIISVIIDRGYIERTQKKFFASSVGITVSDFLLKHFPIVMDYDFTAEMEENLDRISRGEKEWRKTVADFYYPLEKTIESVTDNAERTQIPVEKTGEKCPECNAEYGGEIVIRSGRFGKFKSCNRFPECKFTQNIVEVVEDVICPLCQKGEVTIKNTRWGKPFFGCGNYPKCNWASWNKPEKGETMSKEEWAVLQAASEERKAKWAERNKKSADVAEAKKPAKTTKQK